MALPSWWQVATPHKDIREGKLSEAIFAADLGDVVYGKAPLEYQDASIFFQKTYLTHGLRTLLENVLSRLSGGKGDPVIQLQTPFGGGKTHALLTIYHAVKNKDKITHLDIFSKLPNLKEAIVAVFVGTHADPIKGKTIWGEIAHQLGVYKKIKEHDEQRRAPGRKILNEILGETPVLILIDELVEYAVKAKDYREQISAFSHELTETVKSKDRCCLICTLPSSAPYGEEGERALSELQRIYGRLEAVYTPLEGLEIYEVIRKRLFEDYGDEKTRRRVAQQYFDLYQKLGADVPSEVREITYRENMEWAYPFHPELIDVLYERWGSYPTFQRTRGVLRLLAEVVSDLYSNKEPSPLIQSSFVNLDNQTIRREFVKHIGNEYDSIISADISGKNAKAPKIDRSMGSEYKKYNIAKGIATSVFLYSFSAGESKETTLPRIRVALLREGIPSTIVGDAIAKLEEELWYFHSEGNRYSFRNQPNINRVIVDKEESISDEIILEEMRRLLQKVAGRSLEVYLWPESSADIPDNKNLKLAILSPDYPYGLPKSKELIKEFFEKAGGTFRVYRNTLFMLLLDENQYVSLSKAVRRLLALNNIQKDSSLLDILTKQSQEELRKRLKDAEREIPFKILNAYRHLTFLKQDGVEWKDLGIPTIGGEQSISERVKQYLKDHEVVLTRLTPKYLLDKTMGKDEQEKSIRDMYELHLKTPGMPIPENEKVFLDAVAEGVQKGILGVREDKEIYYSQNIVPNMDSIVLRGQYAQRLKDQEKDRISPPPPPPPPPPWTEKEIIRKVSLRAVIPWDKLSQIVTGVIRPLKDKGNPYRITIEIEADSEEGFDRTTLDTKVRETFQQIGAEIEKWEEK